MKEDTLNPGCDTGARGRGKHLEQVENEELVRPAVFLSFDRDIQKFGLLCNQFV